MNNYFFNQHGLSFLVWLGPLIIVDLILRGIALWKAARSSQLYWFIALVIINSVGILPIIYLLFFQKKQRGVGQ